MEPGVLVQGAGVVCGFGDGITGVLFFVDVKNEHGDGLFDVRETRSSVGARVDSKHFIKRFIKAELFWPETIDIVDVGAGIGTNEVVAWDDIGFAVGTWAGNSSGAASGLLILEGKVEISGIPFDKGLEPNDVQLKFVAAGFEEVTISTSLFNAGLKSGYGGDKDFSLETKETLVPETIDNNSRKKFNKSEWTLEVWNELDGELDGGGIETGRLGTWAAVEGRPKPYGRVGRALNGPALERLEPDNELQVRGILQGFLLRPETWAGFDKGTRDFWVIGSPILSEGDKIWIMRSKIVLL